ncbi:uncharacterized protein VTP21DRAFT_2498 [Calcarisporiella thermophila]|uniref:uncharacterized protein n=1 Tax=Calcarisporiella thermophila TaxID=911321 RepID=UPI0037445DCA
MVRFKNRWILFEVIWEKSLVDSTVDGKYLPAAQGDFVLSSRDLIGMIKDAVLHNFGDYGQGCVQSSLSIKYFSAHTNIGILRVSRDHFRMAWGALTFIKQICGRQCMIRVIHNGGTIKKCQHAAIEYDREQILALAKRHESKGRNFPSDQLLIESKNHIMSIEN